jgi:hypothetical protein
MDAQPGNEEEDENGCRSIEGAVVNAKNGHTQDGRLLYHLIDRRPAAMGQKHP